MFELARPDAINLGIGELDFEPPEVAKRALTEAINSGFNGYGPTKGLPEFRQELAERLRKYRIDVEIDNVIVTTSATQGIICII